jgi:ketosteroid isomerase-like protein
MDSAAFAARWEQDWNSHDLDRILGHYRDDIVFRSRKAIPLVGTGEIQGKQALREYWTAALKHQPDLRFHVKDVFEGHDMLIISYINHRQVLATEVLCFDGDGKVFWAAACHRRTQE